MTVTVFGWLCAGASVALGAVYMFVAGAPQRYTLVNAAALAVGLIAASLVRRVPVCDRAFGGAGTVAIGLLLLATALFGVHIDGASRWIGIAGIALEPSLIVLPIGMMHFARDRRWLSSIGLVIAAIGLGLQPDRAMAGTLAAGLASLWLHRREPPVTLAFVAAISGLTVTMVRGDVVAPVPFVEQVVQAAFAFHFLTGMAIVAGLATMLLPAAAGLGTRIKEREVFAVFGATWLAVIAFAIVGNYPTPLVGYGSSAILGYVLSAAVLSRSQGRSQAAPGP
jgi:cell division protein FtsW (lipid II flippase)